MSKTEWNLGLAQRKPLPGLNNLEALREDIQETLHKHPQLDLLVYPEMHLQDVFAYPPDEHRQHMLNWATPLDGDLVRALGQLAHEFKIWLIPGSINESHQGKLYNTELLIAPSGHLQAAYRKMFPWRPHEPHDYGREFITSTIMHPSQVSDSAAAGQDQSSLTLGLSNCYDTWFPEHSRHLSWLGAQAIINIVKTTSDDRQQELTLAQANAISNQIYFFSVNCAEPLGRGGSIAVDPEGKILAQAAGGEETLLVQYSQEVLDRVRQEGTCGTNRIWHQFTPQDPPIALPMYSGQINPATWAPSVQGAHS
ncbi:carbon-nitrogen hydrolase family protein [Rothia sp. P5764]|uniref:carbon-nitrogen hydrolase family protein n=1 Tax=Rothia sp. P5764 TaxID=3402654 RepID=UPI003AD17928